MTTSPNLRFARASCAISLTIGLSALVSIHVHGQSPGRTSRPGSTSSHTVDGHPDLGGLYNAATVTPLERPDVFQGKAIATEAEAIKYAKDFLDAGNIDRRDPDPRVDVGQAYENIFLDRGTSMARLRGTIPT